MVSGPAPMCVECKHYGKGVKDPDNTLGCRAFPGGIPDQILFGFDHKNKGFPGDRGIRFEPKD